MTSNDANENEFPYETNSGSISTAIIAGAMVGIILLPVLLPGLVTSILGPSPKAFWFLSRGAAMVAFILLWASMALGISITNRLARVWPGGPLAFDFHQFLSLIGLGFAIFHALILLGDQYAQYSVAQLLMPFAASSYKPFWVGLGQMGVYLWAMIVASFYVRKHLGHASWRLIHFASYVAFSMALIHGLISGTDSSAPLVQGMYWLAGGSLIFLLFYRILAVSQSQPRRSMPKA